ncbi:MAG: DoxX family protein [Planctomycetota bacterium]|nr:DoxX family protein [Planctomycetota bacterium]
MSQPSHSCAATDFGLLLIRVIVATVMVYHGAGKLFPVFGGPTMESKEDKPGLIENVEKMGLPMPKEMAYAAAFSEFFGGILVGLGVLTRLAAIPIAITMFVAAFKVHGHAFSLKDGGMEYALTMAVIATALIFTGAGRISFDGIMGARRGSRVNPVSAVQER